MNYYELVPHDQVHNNWLLFTEQKHAPYVLVKSEFNDCVCPKCKKIDHDKAFAKGFEGGTSIRAKGDFLVTSEGFTCISQKARLVIESSGFRGISLKEVSDAGWWVVNVTCRVDADQSAYTITKRFCDYCGRPKETIGLIRCLNQISPPNQCGMFFAPTFDRGGSMNGDRDLFVTEDIVVHFKQQKLKGAMFARLLTAQEFSEIKAAGAEKNPLQWPKDSRVVL